MADGTITIDLDLNTHQFKSDTQMVNEVCKKLGSNAGQDMDSSFSKNSEKVKSSADKTHKQLVDKFGKPIKTEFTATNTGAKDTANETKRNYDKVPKSKKTELEAQDKASPVLKKTGNEVEKTGSKFHRLRDIIHGTFIGTLASNAVSSALTAIGSKLSGVYSEGMKLNAATAGIERRFRGMGMSSRWVNAYMTQISYLRSRINATGSDIATLQTNITTWSRIGRSGALKMTEAIGEMGDRTNMTSEGYQRLSMYLMRVGSSGKVSLGALNRIARIAPGLYRQLAEGAGVSENHMKSMLATGKVTTEQFQKWLADSTKSGENAFNEYAHTQAGATVRMRASWQTLEATMTKPLFNLKTSGLNQLADLMQSKAVTSGAKMIGDGVKQIAMYGLQILAAIGHHKSDIVAVASDLIKIAGLVVKDIWEDFAGIITDIGKDFGLVHSGAKGSISPLHAVRQTLDGIAKHKGAIKAIANILFAIAAIHGIKKVIDPILKLAHTKVGSGTILDSLKNPANWKGLSSLKQLRSLSGKDRIEVAAAVVFEGAQVAGELNKAIHEKDVWERTTDSGEAIGRGLGTGIGLLFGGKYGAVLGGEIGAKLGKSAGDAFEKAWRTPKARKRTKDYGFDNNSGYSVKSQRAMTKGFREFNKALGKWHPIKAIEKKFKGLGPWFTKLGKGTAKNMHAGWDNTKHWANGVTKDVKYGWHDMNSWFDRLGKSTAKNMYAGWNNAKRWAGEVAKNVCSGWNGMQSWFGKLGKDTANGLKAGWRGVVGWFAGIVKSIRHLWSSISGIFGNVKKLFTGKLKVGSLHLASGTDWRKRYPIPAIVNDGNDSPATNNREGLIDTDGTLRLFPDIRNFRYWLKPGQEVVNARDMSMFGAIHHFAKGTTNFGGGATGRTSGVTSIRSLNRELKDLEKTLKQVRKLSRINVTAKGLAKNLKDVSRLNKALKSIDTESAKANRNFRTLTNRLTSLARKIKSFYSTVKKYNFGKALAREASQAVKGLRDKGNFANEFSKLAAKFKKTAESLQTDFHKTWSDTWDHADKTFKSWTKTTENELSRFKRSFERGWESIDSGVTRIFSKFWSTMWDLAGKGMNRVISVVNSGISKINGVVHQFGGNTHSIGYAGHVHYANGTSTALQKPTFAVVNDGNDSPETGNKESFFDHNTGEFGIFQGRNTHMLIPAGVDIFKASDTRDFMRGLGYGHFADGTGSSLKQLYELTKHYYKNPNSTLDDMMTTSIGMHGAINQIATGMAKRVQHQAEDWWGTLWTMVHEKIDSGSASGLLKAVEKYGNGHRYVWGAAGPSTFDCSGLVMYALKKAYGISYPHFSGSQYARTRHISKSEAKPGDLVFWGPGGSDHVGVYAGGNRYFSAESPSMGIHMNTLSSVVGKGAPKFGRVRGINPEGQSATIKANTGLEKLIRGQVGKGFWATIKKIADKYGVAATPAGDGVARWRHIIKAALSANHLAPTNWRVSDMMRLIARESGGNPRAVNNWDINAQHGDPSKGLAQITVSNFRRYHHRGFNNILNGYDNLLAAIRYIIVKYGSGLAAFSRVASGAYANGGFVTEPTDATLGEGNGPEVVLPYGDPSKRERTLQLMQATIAQMQAQDGQGAEANVNKQVTLNMEETNAAIAEINSKFDKTLQALGIIQGKDTKVYVTNDIDPKKVGTAIYPIIKEMDSSNIRKAGANLSGYQSY